MYSEHIIMITNTVKINRPIILYRGDYNIEVKLKIINNPYKDVTKAQLVMISPNKTVVLDESPFIDNTCNIVIPAEVMDDVQDIGTYAIQLILMDDNSSVSLPEIEQAMEIRESKKILMEEQLQPPLEDNTIVDNEEVNNGRYI